MVDPITASEGVLSGAWTLNRELSSPASLSPDSDSEPSQRSDDEESRWRSRVGGAGGGHGMPGRPDPEEMRRVRNTMGELLRAPLKLLITQTADEVTFVDTDGHTRRYRTNGKKQKNQLVSGVVESETTWDGKILEQKVSVSRGARVTFSYALDPAPDRLVVVVERSGSRDADGPALRWVYDRVQ
jgi:hypothetical protein